jgi:hypothetical protein
VYAVEEDGAGGVYVGGGFEFFGGRRVPYLAHVAADGAVAPEPAAVVDAPVGPLHRYGGELILGGQFRNVGGAPRQGMAAITADGTPTSFDPGPWHPGWNTVAEVPDGLLFGGGWMTMAHSSVQGLARFPATGSGGPPPAEEPDEDDETPPVEEPDEDDETPPVEEPDQDDEPSPVEEPDEGEGTPSGGGGTTTTTSGDGGSTTTPVTGGGTVAVLPGGAAGPSAPRLELAVRRPARRAALARGVPVRLRSTAGGAVRLELRDSRGRRVSRRATVTLTAGAARVVRLRLLPAPRRTLARGRKLTVRAAAKGGGSRAISKPATLR